MNLFQTFRCLTVIYEVHMERYMLTLRLQLLEVFRLHVMPRHVFETTPRNVKPVKLSFFCFVLEHVVWFSFLVSRVKPYEKLSV